jgi:hypothetical protein
LATIIEFIEKITKLGFKSIFLKEAIAAWRYVMAFRPLFSWQQPCI